MKKARVAVLVARPTLQASRIAHPVETSNAEAHADMYISARVPLKKVHFWLLIYNIPMNIYCCFVFDRIQVCETLKSQEQSVK